MFDIQDGQYRTPTMSDPTDFLVIGAGVIGLRVAIEAKRRFPDASVTVIEKEARPGRHASGRNSGVLHAGFYYSADRTSAPVKPAR
jgi:L-2-hydroxyglutarate oxidase LhgO